MKDIRFWIVLFFVIRLFNITQAPLEISHNWRQVTGNMIARNFLETDANIFYPRLDFAGEKDGITGTEFPLMNYLHYGISKVFGYQHWYGRLINLILASLGIWYFFRIVRRFFTEEHAFYASLILLFSLWFSFSRKSMPDIFSISLCMMSLYYGLRYLYDQKGVKDLLLYFILGTLGILSKIPSAYIFILFFLPMLDKKIPLKSKNWFAMTSILILLPSIWWYFSWVPHLNEQSGFVHYFMGDPILVGAKEIMANLGQTSMKFYADAMGYIAFILFVGALFWAIKMKEKKVIIIFGLVSFTFVLYIFKSGYNFPHHSYYILPFVPALAFVLGWGLTQIPKKAVVYSALGIIAIENVANQQHDFFTKDSEKHKLKLESILDQFSGKDDLIAISGAPNPQEIYFAHRKGWIFNENDLQSNEFLKKIDEGGCKLVVINKHHFDQVIEGSEKIFEDEDYRIYENP
ncbi:MAG: glycosyltransferase family 39 protein [Crocinitomicaceae bacterium]